MDAEYYKINQLFMSWIGQWPEQSNYNKLFLSFNLLFAVGSQFCLLVCSLVTVWQNWDLVIECLSPLTIHALCLIKYLNFILNNRKFKILLMQMRNNWKLATLDTSQIQILKTYSNEGKKLTRIYAVIIYISMSTYITMPLVPYIVAFFTNANQTQIYGLLYHVETVLDTKKYYYPILVHSCYSTFFLMTIPIATDSMLITYVQHACALFEVIGYQLGNLKQNDEIDINIYPLPEDDEHYRMISDSVVKHEQVLQFSRLLASSYSTTLFVSMILTVAFITFSGIQVVINLNQPAEAFRFAMATVCLTTHFLFLSLPGQKLIDHSSNMHQFVYAMNWYAISLRARKLLNVMQMRSKVPCQIRAGKVNIICLRSFCTVVKASMSYFTLLTSLQ